MAHNITSALTVPITSITAAMTPARVIPARAENWIQTFTGKQFWPTNPRAVDLDILDIAHALAMKCRYTGHTIRFYSVAQHCVIMSQNVPPEHALWALLHDATEAYLPDVARPVKAELAGFREIEDRLMETIAGYFGLPMPVPDIIHTMDRVMLETERRDLMTEPPAPWSIKEGPLKAQILPLMPSDAEAQFLRRYIELTSSHRRLGGGQ
jgi:hypothetical protein